MHDMREQIITGVIAVAILGLFWQFVVTPRQDELHRMQEDARDVAAQIIARDQLGHEALTTEVELQQQQTRISSLDSQIPNKVQLGAFLEQLSDDTQNTNLRSIDVAPRSPHGAQGLGVLPIRMTFEGTFASLYEFLKRIESQDRIVYVSTMKTSRMDPGSRMLTTELTLQIFYEEG